MVNFSGGLSFASRSLAFKSLSSCLSEFNLACKGASPLAPLQTAQKLASILFQKVHAIQFQPMSSILSNILNTRWKSDQMMTSPEVICGFT